MDQILTIVLTTVLTFTLTKVCQLFWDKLNCTDERKQRNKKK